MLKRLSIIISICLMLTACGANEGTTAGKGLTTKEMTSYILEQIKQPTMLDVNEENLRDLYEIDPTILEEYSVQIPLMTVDANELAIFKAVDKDNIPLIEKGIAHRIAYVQKQFGSDMTHQNQMVKQHQIVVKGNYVLLVISNKAEDIIELFKGYF